MTSASSITPALEHTKQPHYPETGLDSHVARTPVWKPHAGPQSRRPNPQCIAGLRGEYKRVRGPHVNWPLFRSDEVGPLLN